MTEQYWDGENWLEKEKYYNFTKYLLNNKRHRLDGPATIYYYRDSNSPILYEYYEYYGKLHRSDGPAVIKYLTNGIIEKEEFWFDGIKLNFNPKEIPFDLPIDTEEKELYIKLKYGVVEK